MQNRIQEFNVKLVQDNIDITIIDYVKKINDMFYNIDISFIDDFVDMVNNDDFIIHHNMLDKYDVIKITDTSHVKRLFQQHDFEDGVEYISMPDDLAWSFVSWLFFIFEMQSDTYFLAPSTCFIIYLLFFINLNTSWL